MAAYALNRPKNKTKLCGFFPEEVYMLVGEIKIGRNNFKNTK